MEKLEVLHIMPIAKLIEQSKRKSLPERLKKLFGVESKQAQPLHPLEPLLWTMIRKAPLPFVNNAIEHIGLLQQIGCTVQVQLITQQTPNVVGYLHCCHYAAKPVWQVRMMLQVLNDVAVLYSASEYHNPIPLTV